MKIGKRTEIKQPTLTNLYGCVIGDDCIIGAFVEIQKNAKIGDKCKISSHSFICEGVTLEDEVFIGHGVMFINDKYPKSTKDGKLKNGSNWELIPTIVKKGASIGTNTTIMCGVTIGENSTIGAGSLVLNDVPKNSVLSGVIKK